MPDDVWFETLDVHARDAASLEKLTAYADCWSQAFFEGRLSERSREIWLEASRADDVTLRAAYAAGTLRPATAPVATYSSWLGELNVGAGRTVPLHLISDVAVEPTHRRRGVLRRLMSDDLTAAAAAGRPLAALNASEGTIYGRFGFGPATRKREVRVDASARFGLHQAPKDRRVELVDPQAAYATIRDLDAAVLEQTRGAIAKPAFYSPFDAGRFDSATGEPDRAVRVAVVLDADDRPSGYARLVTTDLEDQPGGETRVKQLCAVDDASYLALWQLLASLDLVTHVTASIRPDDLLDVAVTDPRVIRTERLRDQIWLRVLDPVAALRARPWREDGSLVLEVTDPLDLASATLRVSTLAGLASVERSSDAPDVSLDIATLSTLYLGDRTVADLASAGRISGPGAQALSAMADHAGPPPWCTTQF